MYCVTVTFAIQPGQQQAFMDAVMRQARNSLELEADCLRFDVCTESGGERVFLYEIYRNAAAFKAHLASRHFQDFDRQVRAWVADKQVATWERLEPADD